jgi:hypothetical protein
MGKHHSSIVASTLAPAGTCPPSRWLEMGCVTLLFYYCVSLCSELYIATATVYSHCLAMCLYAKILTVYSLYIQEAILYAKEKCNCAVNKQVHKYNTRNNDYHRYIHNLDLYNSKPSAAGCIFYNKLPRNMKPA